MKPLHKQEGKRMVRVVVTVKDDVARQAKHAAIDEGTPLSHIMGRLLEQWLATREKRRG